MPTGNQRKRSLLPEWPITNILMTDWTPGTAREMCIDADIQAHRPSKTSAALMTRTRLCLLGDLFGEDFNGGICSSSFFKSTVAFGTIPPVSATEAAEAVTRLKSGKVKWPDGISAELGSEGSGPSIVL